MQAVASLNGGGDAGRAIRDSRSYADWLALQDRIKDYEALPCTEEAWIYLAMIRLMLARMAR